jgi:hypothetical protein
VWQECPTGNEPCSKGSGPVFFLAIKAGPVQNTLLDVVSGQAIVANHLAVVYYDALPRVARRKTTPQTTTLLACVIAHELGHLLLGAHGHSIHGIMRDRWDIEQTRRALMSELDFLPEEGKLMRSALLDGTQPGEATQPALVSSHWSSENVRFIGPLSDEYGECAIWQFYDSGASRTFKHRANLVARTGTFEQIFSSVCWLIPLRMNSRSGTFAMRSSCSSVATAFPLRLYSTVLNSSKLKSSPSSQCVVINSLWAWILDACPTLADVHWRPVSNDVRARYNDRTDVSHQMDIAECSSAEKGLGWSSSSTWFPNVSWFGYRIFGNSAHFSPDPF